MRLRIFSEFSAPLGKGVYNRHHELASQLQAMGVDVTVVVASYHHFLQNNYEVQKGFTQNEFGGVKTIILKTLTYKDASSKWRLINWWIFFCRAFRYQNRILTKGDIILISSPSPINILLGFYRKVLFGNKVIFEIRDIWPLTLMELGKYSKFHPLIMVLKFLEKLAYRSSDFLISTLPFANIHIKSVLKNRNFRFECLPQGFNPTIFDSPEELPEGFVEKYLPKDKFIIGYAGTIGLSNALESIVELTGKMDKTHPEIAFVFVGGGALKNQFVNATKDQGNVVFAPAIKKSQVQTLLKHIHVVYDSVHDSHLYSFGLSRNKWIDYLHAGKPLLFSGPTKGITMLTESQCGFIVPPNNINLLESKIEEISKLSHDELDAIGLRGKEYVIGKRPYAKLAQSLYHNVLTKL